jgi:hypothetical protein
MAQYLLLPKRTAQLFETALAPHEMASRSLAESMQGDRDSASSRQKKEPREI